MNQLFVIGNDVLHAFDLDEMHATVDALQQLGFYKLPYEKVDLEYDADAMITMYRRMNRMRLPDIKGDAKGFRIRVVDLCIDGPPPRRYIVDRGRLTLAEDKSPTISLMAPFVKISQFWETKINRDESGFIKVCCCDMLISMLAVKNIRKTTTIDKLAKLGIGRKHRNIYTTTLSLPLASEMRDDHEHPPGERRCPHLRRGHIRNQRHGPRSELTKQIWIAPIFVHADEEYVKQRSGYNVSKTK